MITIGDIAAISILKRIAEAMERANELELHRQELEFPPLKTTDPPKKKFVIDRVSVEDMNKRHAGVPLNKDPDA